MTYTSEQPLESTQFYGNDGVLCVCCGIQYPSTSGHCRRCQAPLELAQTTIALGRPPRFVSVLGESGSGKTVYLGMLMDMLSKGVLGMRGVPQGSYSVAVQGTTIAALERRGFPDKTAAEPDAWRWIHCEVTGEKRNRPPLDLITGDFAGEAIALEIEQTGTYPAIRSVVSQSIGVLLLCDAFSVSRDPLNEDIAALKLASYIYDVQGANSTSRKDMRCKTPLGVVFTKSDRCRDAQEAPRQFAAKSMPRLLQYCQRGFSQFSFFAARVVAGSATSVDEYGCCSQVALHVEPHGIAEPLHWIMKSC